MALARFKLRDGQAMDDSFEDTQRNFAVKSQSRNVVVEQKIAPSHRVWVKFIDKYCAYSSKRTSYFAADVSRAGFDAQKYHGL